jgi:plasmid stability protein
VVAVSSIMMLVRTTLTLDDDVLRMARRRAAEDGRPLKDVINEALRAGLRDGGTRRRPAFAFKLRTVTGRVMPGVDLTDRDKLFDLMDGR